MPPLISTVHFLRERLREREKCTVNIVQYFDRRSSLSLFLLLWLNCSTQAFADVRHTEENALCWSIIIYHVPCSSSLFTLQHIQYSVFPTSPNMQPSSSIYHSPSTVPLIYFCFKTNAEWGIDFILFEYFLTILWLLETINQPGGVGGVCLPCWCHDYFSHIFMNALLPSCVTTTHF